MNYRKDKPNYRELTSNERRIIIDRTLEIALSK
jgi:hypothetical protein